MVDNKLKPISSFSFCLLLLLSCSGKRDPGPLAGNVSETTNGIIHGAIQDSTGLAKTGIAVSVYSQKYLPQKQEGFTEATITGENGEFEFDSLEVGFYNFFSRESASGLATFVQNVEVTEDAGANLGALTLQITGSFSGIVQDNNGVAQDSALVFVKGSPFVTLTDFSGIFTLAGMPAGNFNIDFEKSVSCSDLPGPVLSCFGVDTMLTYTSYNVIVNPAINLGISDTIQIN